LLLKYGVSKDKLSQLNYKETLAMLSIIPEIEKEYHFPMAKGFSVVLTNLLNMMGGKPDETNEPVDKSKLYSLNEIMSIYFSEYLPDDFVKDLPQHINTSLLTDISSDVAEGVIQAVERKLIPDMMFALYLSKIYLRLVSTAQGKEISVND
jgi:hypothetical protein